MGKKWNPTTRCVRYDAARVAAACRRKAEKFRSTGDEKDALSWENAASAVETGSEHPQGVAYLLLSELEYDS